MPHARCKWSPHNPRRNNLRREHRQMDRRHPSRKRNWRRSLHPTTIGESSPNSLRSLLPNPPARNNLPSSTAWSPRTSYRNRSCDSALSELRRAQPHATPSLGQAHIPPTTCRPESGTGTLDLHINSGQAPVSCSSGLNMQFGALGTSGAGGGSDHAHPSFSTSARFSLGVSRNCLCRILFLPTDLPRLRFVVRANGFAFDRMIWSHLTL